MKTAVQAVFISLMIHMLYIAVTIGIGCWETKIYQPNIVNAWERVYMLQNEVVFGHTGSPVVYLFSFVVIAVISAIIIRWHKTLRG
ncbi:MULTISPECIES: hypothetical protein [Anoxybacillaceae]|uniref:hypothetical protein n=1 Tax=Anoxybacillaceae TaxID=3120669 RepID=UPI0007614CC9|nr:MULTISPECIES: hypothetical protein [Bacillaceae]BDG36155.1 hypothetical protein PcaKH15_20610 [Parageobacillus caldoxylosilyticus]BDG39940.1 hypothetical protein PcaKH16_20790 [Parageobacillus caldoxylosilyticus]